MIPDSVLSEIQDKVNIVDVISPFAPLKRAGRNFKGRCLFHEEKSPSFMVSPDKQIFHCFGCGVSGNIFGFLMKYKKIGFREAAQELADRAGVQIPEDEAVRAKNESRNEIYQAVKVAAVFYQEAFREAPSESPVKRYAAKRGLTDETLRKFGIGFSPEAWDAFYQYGTKRLAAPLLEKAGLIMAKTGGGFYDRFRNRLMFPIQDAKGNHIGFGARTLDDSVPKYLNSPETEIYHKGWQLYGLNLAADSARRQDQLILVEGYMDVIACVQAGVENVVAASGTALTIEQIRLMKRYTRNVVVLFDADKAGEMATLRGLDLLVQEECEVRVAEMPQGDDPDTYIKAHGAQKFKEGVIGAAKTLFDYKFGFLGKRFNAKKAEDKARIAMEMIETLRKIPNAVLRASFITKLAQELKVPEAAIAAEMEKKGAGLGAVMEPAPASAASARAVGGEAPMIERLLIGLFLTFPDSAAQARGRIQAADFNHASARSVAEMIFESGDEPVKPAQLLNRVQDDREASQLVARAVHEAEHIEDAGKALLDCIRHLENGRRDRRREELRRQITAAELGGDLEKRNKLLAEFMEFSKKEKLAGNEKK